MVEEERRSVNSVPDVSHQLLAPPVPVPASNSREGIANRLFL